MASIDDVLLALKTAVIAAVTPLPNANKIKVGVGFPNIMPTTTDLEQGAGFIGIFPLKNERLTTRFFPGNYTTIASTPLLAAAVTGNTIAFSGSVAAGYAVDVVVNSGQLVGSMAVAYVTLGTDTLDSVATAVAAALVAAGFSASASGADVALSGTFSSVVCNIGAQSQIAQEVRRTERHFQIMTVVPGNASTLTAVSTDRSAIVNAIDAYFALQYFLLLADASWGRLKYVSGPWEDDMQRETMLIAHQVFSVEFATIATAVAVPVGAIDVQQTNTTIASIASSSSFYEG